MEGSTFMKIRRYLLFIPAAVVGFLIAELVEKIIKYMMK